MRVFVSLIVWLFSITGRDGLLIVRPSNYVILKGNPLTFTCRSNLSLLAWSERRCNEPNMKIIVNRGCIIGEGRYYTVAKSTVGNIFSCDLAVKTTAPVFSGDTSSWFMCEDYGDASGEEIPPDQRVDDPESTAWATVIVLRSPLKCEAKEKELTCTLQHSAYGSTTGVYQYLEIRLQLKNPMGTVVSSKSAGFMDDTTVVTAALDGGRSFPTTNPYICSASFVNHCDSARPHACVENTNISPPSAVECKYKDSNWATVTAKPIATIKASERPRVIDISKPTEKASETATSKGSSNANDKEAEAEEEDDYEERVAIIIKNGTFLIQPKRSNANLERDGIEAIAMLTCLIVAFLVP